MRRRVCLLAMVIALVGSLTALPTPAHAQQDVDAASSDDGKVLLFTMPGLTWRHLQTHDLPTIETFLDSASVANNAPRGARVRAHPGGAYLTIGAGNRAIGHSSADGQVLSVDDPAAGTPAGEVFERRTGKAPEGDWVLLNWPDLVERNEDQPYDIELGSLVSSLAEIGKEVAAIGNADGADTLEETYEREVGLAAANPDGAVVNGRFGKELVLSGPEAAGRPFGRRLNTENYLAGFRDLWQTPNMGLVVAEASDMARTMRYRDRVDRDRYNELWDLALTEADALFAQVLESVDPARDTVILLAPYNLSGDRDLTVAAMSDPRRPASGYLHTASTQSTGNVRLVDIAPTVIEILGAQRPASMAGRPFVVTDSSASTAERIDTLVSANEASRFRENLLVPTTVLIVVAIGIVCALAIAALSRRTSMWVTNAIGTAALAVMTLFPMSFVARGFEIEELGMGFYWLIVIVPSMVLAGALATVAHRIGRPRLALLGALAFLIIVIGGDVMTGSRLHMSAAFGYSPTGNARLYGISNYALGSFGAAVSLLAGFAASRSRLPARRAVGVGMMVFALLVIGLPKWGANVGGILSFAPVVLLFAMLLFQDRVKIFRLAVGFGVAMLVAIGAFAAIDLTRPADERGHLGRLFERIGDEGIGVVWGFIERKGLAAIEVTFSSLWTMSAVIAIVFMVYMWRVPSRPILRVRNRISYLTAGIAAACLAGFFGTTFNDSGGIVGGTAMLVVAATLTWLILEPEALADVAANPKVPEPKVEAEAKAEAT